MKSQSPTRFPTRTCVACRTTRQKRELVRVVRRPDGTVQLDETGRVAGRGAYLCSDRACWSTALGRGAIQRALGVPLPAELRARLEAESGAISAAGTAAAAHTAHGAPTTQRTPLTIDANEGETIGTE
jgi:predicted RNA-binding protein YlxR (DUF448 family)